MTSPPGTRCGEGKNVPLHRFGIINGAMPEEGSSLAAFFSLHVFLWNILLLFNLFEKLQSFAAWFLRFCFEACGEGEPIVE